MVKLTDQLALNANNGEKTAAIFLDVEQAFDRVWRDGLIYKLHQLNIPTQLLKIILSFLNERFFQVRFGSSLATTRLAMTGVAQGSCLSPFLYLVYTDDIPTTPKATLALFADDTMFMTKDRNPSRAILQLQNQVDQALKWFAKWRLQVNAQKTTSILFNHYNIHGLLIKINGHPVNWSTQANTWASTLIADLNFTFISST